MEQMVVTPTDMANYTEAKCDKMCNNIKIIFWTKQQKIIHCNDSLKRIIFTSDYGTGKSTLLRAKVKELIEKKKNENYKAKKEKNLKNSSEGKIFFFNFVEKNALLHKQLENDFGSFEEFFQPNALESSCKLSWS